MPSLLLLAANQWAGVGNYPVTVMKKIRALRQFSHYNAGSFDQFEQRSVTDEIAEALVGMGLAEEVGGGQILEPEPEPEPKKAGGKK